MPPQQQQLTGKGRTRLPAASAAWGVGDGATFLKPRRGKGSGGCTGRSSRSSRKQGAARGARGAHAGHVLLVLTSQSAWWGHSPTMATPERAGDHTCTKHSVPGRSSPQCLGPQWDAWVQAGLRQRTRTRGVVTSAQGKETEGQSGRVARLGAAQDRAGALGTGVLGAPGHSTGHGGQQATD